MVMQKRHRIFLLITLAAVIALIFAAPQFGLTSKITEFAVTPQPADALAKAEKSGQPVFLEFYAAW